MEIYCDKCKKKKCIQRKWGRLVFTADGRLEGFNPQKIEECPWREDSKIIRADFENRRKDGV